MRFEEVLPALREDKKITNEHIKKCGYQYIYYRDRTIFEKNGGYWHLTDEDIVEIDDWEIVKEKKKVKLRDLTQEQLEKWKERNCEGSTCKDCVFNQNKVNCIYVAYCWIKDKSIFSDKFLDQEVEIEE